MKIFRYLLFLLIINMYLTSLAYTFQNEPDGFRGIKWGDNFSNIKGYNFKFEFEDEEIKHYSNKNDHLEIGGIKVNKIVYGFFNDKFLYIFAKFKGMDTFLNLLNVCTEKYGKVKGWWGYSDDTGYYKWVGKISEVRLTHDHKGGLLVIGSEMIEKERRLYLNTYREKNKDKGW